MIPSQYWLIACVEKFICQKYKNLGGGGGGVGPWKGGWGLVPLIYGLTSLTCTTSTSIVGGEPSRVYGTQHLWSL